MCVRNLVTADDGNELVGSFAERQVCSRCVRGVIEVLRGARYHVIPWCMRWPISTVCVRYAFFKLARSNHALTLGAFGAPCLSMRLVGDMLGKQEIHASCLGRDYNPRHVPCPLSVDASGERKQGSRLSCALATNWAL